MKTTVTLAVSMVVLIILTLASVFVSAANSCAEYQPCVTCPEGPAGQDGADGKDGRDGRDGQVGPAGRPGRPGRDGVTTIIRQFVCPDCLDEQMDMRTAVSSAMPDITYLDNKRYSVNFAVGSAEDKFAVGLGIGARLGDNWSASLTGATNLTDSCDDEKHSCMQYYEPFEYHTWRAQVSLAF